MDYEVDSEDEWEEEPEDGEQLSVCLSVYLVLTAGYLYPALHNPHE
jgi:hypothetical protein